MKPEQWIVNGEVGTSSRTIWAVMMDAVIEDDRSWWNYGVPHDPDDFSRCWKLLALFPKWRKQLPKVADKFPEWGPFVREWDKLTTMYESLLEEGSLYGKEMHDFMNKLEAEGENLIKKEVTNEG